MGRLSVAAMLLVACAASGCDVSLSANNRQPLVGPYVLVLWEDEHYYLGKGDPASPTLSIPVEQPIRRIGWDSLHIILQRYGADSTGANWLIVDVRATSVRGPIDSARAESEALRLGLRPIAVESAWVQLRARPSGGKR